jgi:hypothetical protein
VLADEFIRKVWVPAGMLAVAVTFVLAFLLEDPVSDNVVGLIIGLTLIGLPILYAVYRRVSGPKTGSREPEAAPAQQQQETAAGSQAPVGGSRRI